MEPTTYSVALAMMIYSVATATTAYAATQELTS